MAPCRTTVQCQLRLKTCFQHLKTRFQHLKTRVLNEKRNNCCFFRIPSTLWKNLATA
jgi:hypothetical protein